MATNLPTNIDATYADSGDPSIKAHQQYHDIIHGVINGLESNFAATSSARPGNLVVFLGDSICQGGEDPTNNSKADSWPNHAMMRSSGVIRHLYNAGIPGSSTTDCLVRFDTDVTPRSPTMVVLQAGTSDVANGVTFNDFGTNIMSLVAKIRSIGAVPVLCTVPPVAGAALAAMPYRNQVTMQFNNWLRQYASRNSIFMLDFHYILTDPATGGMKSAYDVGDGVHQTAGANVVMGQYAADVLTVKMAPNQPLLCQSDNDDNNLVYKGCFTGYSGSGLPTGWSDYATVPSGSVFSYVTDSAVDGQMLRITHTSADSWRLLFYRMDFASGTFSSSAIAGATSISTSVSPPVRSLLFMGVGATYEWIRVASVSGSGPYTVTLDRGLRYAHSSGEAVVANGAIGDRLLFTCVGTFTNTSAQWTFGTVDPAAGHGMYEGTQNVTRGLMLADLIVPAAATGISARLQVNAGTGTASFGQVGVYNITRLGLPT